MNPGKKNSFDIEKYWQFTGKYRRARDLRILQGILEGCRFDGELQDAEYQLINEWLGHYSDKKNIPQKNRGLYFELITGVRRALDDRVISEVEADAITDLAESIAKHVEGQSDAQTIAMQQLHGILGAIAVDGEIHRSELSGAVNWLDRHRSHLSGLWPYDEIDSVLTGVDTKETLVDQQNFILGVCSEFLFSSPGILLTENLEEISQGGVCACQPEITFQSQYFCVSGQSTRCKKSELWDEIEARSGVVEKNVTRSLNYLVVGGKGNAAWIHRCYGRKIEKAMQYRKSGQKIVIVHENDFWDAAEDIPKSS